MSTFKHIVVATDLSEAAAFAARMAISIARDSGARVTFVHAYALPVTVYGVYPAFQPVEPSVDLARAAEDALDDWTVAMRLNHAIERVVCEGPPSTVLDVVKARDADLLVVGTHGRTGFAHALLGSVAERLVRHSPVPVLTVPAEPKR